MIGVSILGATGSVGRSTLDVLARHPDRYRAAALTASSDVEGMLELCRTFRPELAAMADPEAARKLAAGLAGEGVRVEVEAGEAGLVAAARHGSADYVMAAIVGAAGLVPTLAAAEAGKRVLLANKESVVMSGRLLMDAARASGASVIPIDSEHNALFQCLPSGPDGPLADKGVRRLLLTASGGPFLDRSLEDLSAVTPDEACAHPNWEMGRKISVDSATMMNKGLEVIEACRLFSVDAEAVRVVVHPQSIVHSLVEYCDGSVLAHLGNPDMRTPIAHALAWPRRIDSGVGPLDLAAVGRLDFREPDLVRFPCLDLALQAAAQGGSAPICLNAANEVAVAAFLAGRTGFLDIARVVEGVLAKLSPPEPVGLDEIMALDSEARALAAEQTAAKVI
jgi:1-deoxy-D-xylulose-5-phosphate reductoisomerase